MDKAEWQRLQMVTETYELRVGPMRALVYRWDEWHWLVGTPDGTQQNGHATSKEIAMDGAVSDMRDMLRGWEGELPDAGM